LEIKKISGQLITDQIDTKVAELVSLVEVAELDNTEKRKIQTKINTALKLPDANQDHLQQFFNGHKTDTRRARKNNIAGILIRITRMIIALLLVGLGFGMIIMPAPPYFEMFTLFTIPGSNGNDGVTIMDVISLIVAFVGVSLFISSIVKFKR
jgi:hypothetical protein